MRRWIPLPIPFLLLLAAGVFLPGINWGLPAERITIDPFLFGNHYRWSGEQILALAGSTEDPNRGADVASHASADRTGVVIVNATDEDRARIIRRYRLMSYQPDEWNTLKALSEMKPHQGNFDPKLYQYGGLWVYPVGAMLKASAMLHLIDLRANVAWYLDHPEAFGRFYIVARLWSVIWALVGVCAVYALVSRIVGGWIYPSIAAACFIFMPVVVNMAHEAKPHLAGAVLMLLAVLAASRYVERGSRRSWIMAGVLCGAALGMVLSTLPILLVLPVMVLMRRSALSDKLIVCGGAVAIAGVIYLITNPYVPINFIFHRAVLESNLGNSGAMYHARLTREGIANAVYLIAAGTSPLLALAGTVGAIALGIRAMRFRGNREPGEIRRRATGVLLAAPALCVIGQCVFFATGKPGEFARFMLVPDIFLMIEAVVAIGPWHDQRKNASDFPAPSPGTPGEGWSEGSLRSNGPDPHPSPLPAYRERGPEPLQYVGSALRTGSSDPRATVRSADPTLIRYVLTTLLLTTTAIPGLNYLRAFVRDSRAIPPRILEAERLQKLTESGTKSLAIYADPAPYCLPPVNLFDAPILLLPKDPDPGEGVKLANVSVQAVDVPDDRPWFVSLWTATPISWADKPFDVRTR